MSDTTYRAQRDAVEHLLDVYLLISPTKSRSMTAVVGDLLRRGRAGKQTRCRLPQANHWQDWRLSLAGKLGQIASEQRGALARAAELHVTIRLALFTTRRMAATLGSPSQRKAFTAAELRQAKAELAQLEANVEAMKRHRTRILRSDVYHDAVAALYRAVTETDDVRAYLLGE